VTFVVVDKFTTTATIFWGFCEPKTNEIGLFLCVELF